MQITKYVRKPFEVDAVQVAAENIDEVAKWCQGEVHFENPGVLGAEPPTNPFIKVHVARALNDRQTRAMVGDWVLYAGTGFKVYTNKAFTKSFEVSQGACKDAAVLATKHQQGDIVEDVEVPTNLIAGTKIPSSATTAE